MYVSDQHQFIYFAPTKTASSTIIMILDRYFKAKAIEPPKRDKWPPMAHHSVFLPSKYKDYFVFTSVRNPYSREVSKYNGLCYHQEVNEKKIYQEVPKMTFDQYIDWICHKAKPNDHWRIRLLKDSMVNHIFQQPVYKDCLPITKIDAFVRAENLAEDFIKLPFVHQSKRLNKLLNSRVHFSERKYINSFPSHLRIKYYNHFKEDFEAFNYDYELHSDRIYKANKHKIENYRRMVSADISEKEISALMNIKWM